MLGVEVPGTLDITTGAAPGPAGSSGPALSLAHATSSSAGATSAVAGQPRPGTATISWKQTGGTVDRQFWTPVDIGWTGATVVAIIVLAAGPGVRDRWRSR